MNNDSYNGIVESNAYLKNTELFSKTIESIMESRISKANYEYFSTTVDCLNKEGDVYYDLPNTPLDFLVHGDKTDVKEYIQNFR